MFDSLPTAEQSFLGFIRGRIEWAEFSKLSKEGGFDDPNNFNIEQIIRPLKNGAFPRKNHYEYMWAIYECSVKRLQGYSKSMQIYIASLYIYCNKVQQWGMSVESDFYYLIVNAELSQLDLDEIRQLLIFLEWLHEYVRADHGYDDYFCLLSWTFLRRLIKLTNDKSFQMIATNLMSRNYTKSYLAELSVSEMTPDNWYELHQRIPFGDSTLFVDWKRVILGVGEGM